MKVALRYLSVDLLSRGRYQPRQHFDIEALEELGQSILTQGLIEPLVVREMQNGQYEIIAGERRWRAAMLKGIHELPCVIGQYTNEQTAAMTLVENIQREALNLIEEAMGYRRLLEEFCFTQEDISTLVGKSRSHIANILRLLSLDEKVQDMIQQGTLSLGHARMLVGLSSQLQRQLAHSVVNKQWSVRKLESEVRRHRTNHELETKTQADVKRLSEILSLQMGAPVEFETSGTSSGWLKIKYFDHETLSGLLDKMGLRYD